MENNQASGITPKPVDLNDMTQLDPDWQVSKKCIKERTAVMFNNELIADVHFIVGSGSNQRRIPAHKFIMVTGSPVFYAMFYGGLAEDKKEVTIPDVDPQAFFNLLRYLYCDEVSLEADTVLPTLYAAKKYILTHLAQACVDYLETNVDASNACLLLNQSRIYEEPELKQRCLEVIDSQAEEVLQSDSFADIEYESLKQILSRDSLGTKETVIFEAATRWAKAECTRQGRDVTPEQCREVLGDALYLLRLPTMSSNDFANGASQSGILSKQEIIDIFQYMSADNKPTLRFPTACRKGKLLTTCSRFHVTHKNWVFKTGKNNSIEFCVDKAISVAGFGLYGGGTVAEYTVGIALKHNNGTVLCEERHNISDDGSCNTIQVLFDRPVQIEPNTWYKVVFIEGCTRHGYYGSCGVYNVICDNIKFTFSDSAVAGNHTKVSVGQIPEILFLPLT